MLELKDEISGNTLLVWEADFNNQLSWHEANINCKQLGEGWRVPSVGELLMINKYFHKKGVGNFKNVYYWSNKEFDENHALAICLQDHRPGHGTGTLGKFACLSVRAVKTK